MLFISQRGNEGTTTIVVIIVESSNSIDSLVPAVIQHSLIIGDIIMRDINATVDRIVIGVIIMVLGYGIIFRLEEIIVLLTK